MKKPILFILLLFVLACQKQGLIDTAPAVSLQDLKLVDSLRISSEAMQKDIPATIILPEAYYQDTSRLFPVIYLLHGYSGNHRDWINKMPNIAYWASLFEVIVVLPDGNYRSWYIDSPVNPKSKYASHVGIELPAFIDSQYRTIAGPAGRAITGLSMGGHGALYLGIKYPQQFGAIASMSGGLDLRPFSKNWELSEILGAIQEEESNWETYSVVPNLKELKGRSVPLLIDCGLDDFFLEVNKAAHQELLSLEIEHEFILRPGAHNWEYWTKVMPHHFLFFQQFFNQDENG